MGQKVSSLGKVVSWKRNNPESSKNNENGENSPRDAGTCAAAAVGGGGGGDGCCCEAAISSAPVTADQQTYENIYVCNADPALSDAVGSLHDNCEMCCGGPSISNAEVASINTQTSSKDAAGSKSSKHWLRRLGCRRKSKSSKSCSTPPETVPEPEEVKCEDCVCTHYQRTEDHDLGAGVVFDVAPDIQVDYNEEDEEEDNTSTNDMHVFDAAFNAFNAFENRSRLVLPSFDEDIMDLQASMNEVYMNEDFEDRAYKERAKEIQEGIEPPPGFRPGLQLQLLELNLPNMTIDNLTSLFQRAAISAFNAPQDMDDSHKIHTSIDYIHYLVPDLLKITNCSFYWGKMDRYEAEKLLDNKPEGTFLLRDSAQEEYLFSVSFRKYGRSLHARIEQWNHLFSFDSRDPGVFASSTVCGLIEHYKDPTCCMFFEPMLTIPLNRNFTFSLQHTSRATVCNQITYDDVNQLKLPKSLKSYLKEYHYKQRVRVRIFDSEN